MKKNTPLFIGCCVYITAVLMYSQFTYWESLLFGLTMLPPMVYGMWYIVD